MEQQQVSRVLSDTMVNRNDVNESEITEDQRTPWSLWDPAID